MITCKNTKLTNLLLAIKILLSLFLTYLLMFKGDVGVIVNNIGNFIVSGNSIIGFIYLLSILAIYPVFLFNVTEQHNNLRKIKNFLLIFDMAMVFVNTFCGILHSTLLLNMPLQDVLNKFSILINGFTIISCVVSLCILTLLKYFNKSDDENNNDTSPIQTINPLFFNGRIERLPYLITKIILYTMLIFVFVIAQHYSQETLNKISIISIIFTQIIFVLSLYAANKRIKDIKWNCWLLLIWIIPYIGLCIGLPLLFIKSKCKTIN